MRDSSLLESQFYADSNLSVKRTNQAVAKPRRLRSQIRVRQKREVPAGGNGVFETFSRSVNTNVVQRY